MRHTINYTKPSPYSRPIRKGINAKLQSLRIFLTYRKQVNYIISHYNYSKKQDYTVLDVGCGSGEFLEHLSQSISSKCLKGLELDKRLVGEVKKRCEGISVYESSAEDLPFTDASLDCITTFHNIEHLYKPENFISESYRCLKKDGILILATPNPDGIAAKLLKEKWHSFQLEDHVSLKSPNEWQKLFTSKGFFLITEGTTFFTGLPIVSKSPLQLVNYALLSTLGSASWNGGEAYHAIFIKSI